MLRNFAVFKHEDPSPNYKVSGKIGQGGYASLFLVDELKYMKTTGKQFALKIYPPPGTGTVADRELSEIRTEVAILNHCDDDSIVRFREAYFYKNRYWIFMEYMKGGPMVDICLEAACQLSEGFIKYTLHMILKGISYLHS